MKKYLYLLLIVYTAVTGFYFFLGWSQLPQGQKYIYSLDDVYIHLALARNFAEHGVWSVNGSGFDSSSSSILYTLILSGLIKILGDWEYYPLVLNIIFGYLTVYAVHRYFRTFFGSAVLQWSLILLLPFTLLHFSVLIGMEHTLHMCLMVIAVYFIHKNTFEDFKGKTFAGLLAITFFISMVRFESMFFTVSLAFGVLLRHKFQQSVLILIAGSVPVIVFGIISIQNGGFFFPNSVLIKGSYPSENGIPGSAWHIFEKGLLLNKQFYKYLFFPFIILLFHLLKKYKGKTIGKMLRNETLIITVVSVGLLQSLFAVLNMRYENYVLISVLLLIIPIASSYLEGFNFRMVKCSFYKVAMFVGIGGFVAISAYRFIYHHPVLKVAPKNISEQQIEMSRFLKEFYGHQKIVANDIGAISYFSKVELLDIVGLGSTEVASMHMKTRNLGPEAYNRLNGKFMAEYCAVNKYKIAVIYTDWFPGGIPAEWTLVGSWTIQDNRVAARERVDFYALNKKEITTLVNNLKSFNLNPNVKQTFYGQKQD